MNPRPHWLHHAAEHYALPVVCAFGLGVLITLHATDTERALLRAAVVLLADQVEHARIVCGAQPDSEAIAATFVDRHPHEARK